MLGAQLHQEATSIKTQSVLVLVECKPTATRESVWRLLQNKSCYCAQHNNDHEWRVLWLCPGVLEVGRVWEKSTAKWNTRVARGHRESNLGYARGLPQLELHSKLRPPQAGKPEITRRCPAAPPSGLQRWQAWLGALTDTRQKPVAPVWKLRLHAHAHQMPFYGAMLTPQTWPEKFLSAAVAVTAWTQNQSKNREQVTVWMGHPAVSNFHSCGYCSGPQAGCGNGQSSPGHRGS